MHHIQVFDKPVVTRDDVNDEVYSVSLRRMILRALSEECVKIGK